MGCMVRINQSGDGTGTYIAQAAETADMLVREDGSVNGDHCRVASVDNLIILVSHTHYDDEAWTELITRLRREFGAVLGSHIRNYTIRSFGPSAGIQLSDVTDDAGIAVGDDVTRHSRPESPGVVVLEPTNNDLGISPSNVLSTAAGVVGL